MAKQPTARATIKNDPFASVIPLREGADAVEAGPDAAPPPAPGRSRQPLKRQKLTVHLWTELVERVKNAAYWNPRLTIASIVEMGIYDAIERIEKEYGGPYPRRESEIRGGRPMK
jgi:hypothetical protein